MNIKDDRVLQLDSESEKQLIDLIKDNKRTIINSKHELFIDFENALQELDNEMEFSYDKDTGSHIAYYYIGNKLYTIYIPVDVSEYGNFLGINGVIHIILKDENFDCTKNLIETWDCEIELTKQQRKELEDYLKSKNIKYFFK